MMPRSIRGSHVTARTIGLAALLSCAPAAAVAQEGVAASVSSVQPEQMRARFQIAAMEGVLERAVQLGARRLSQQVQAVSPDLLFLAGAARARGFWLDGYGVFFDVDVPALRRSVAWSFRMLEQGQRSADTAVQSLKAYVAAEQDAAVRRRMEELLRQLERTVVRPAPAPAAVGAAAAAGGSGQSQPSSEQVAQAQAFIDDPGLAYTNEVKAALVDAMIEYGAPIPIAGDQWLTVAARDNDESRLGGDPYDVATIILRIRGADLDAYRSGKLSRDEVQARVDVREY